MTRSAMTCQTRTSRMRTMVLMGLVVLALLDSVTGIPYRRSLLRLCSKNLSDALYLACKDRGYNEPFSYSSEDDPQDSMGPGLAEECCYRQCSFSQLQQYCKADKAAVKKSVWIVNWIRPGTSSEERSRSDIDHVPGTIKCRIHGSKGARKKSTNSERDDDGGCDGKTANKRHRGGHCGCRHRQQRRRRFGKVVEKALADRSLKTEVLSAPPISSN